VQQKNAHVMQMVGCVVLLAMGGRLIKIAQIAQLRMTGNKVVFGFI